MIKQIILSLHQWANLSVLAEYALMGALSPTVSALFAISLQPIVDAAVLSDLSLLGRDCLIALGLGIADFILHHRMLCRRTALINGYTSHLRREFFRLILTQQPQHFFAQDSSTYLSKLTTDAPLIATDYLGSILDIYRCIWSLAASLAVLATAGWELALLVTICSLISVYLPKCLQNRSQQAHGHYLDASQSHLALARESLENFLPIHLHRLLSARETAYRRCTQEVEATDNTRQRLRLTMDSLAGAISQLSFLAILIGSVYLVLQGKLSVGYTMSVTQLLGGITAPFELFPGYFLALRTGRVLAEKALAPLEEKICVPGHLPLPHPPQSITFHGVSFSYPQHPPLLDNLSLHLELGKKYALVGESGCGKSTLAKLLMGFLTPTQGSITVDGLPLSQIKQADYYRFIGYQGQTPTFFRDTLERNILLGRNLSPADLDSLLQQVKLSHWIDQLPHGISTPVEEGGKNLSGGQAQRLALARCLATSPTFLVLDEVTSALDPQTAAELEHTILSLEGVGLISITHRIQEKSMRQYDTIFLMKDGTIAQAGTWDQLMECGSLLASLTGQELLSCDS